GARMKLSAANIAKGTILMSALLLAANASAEDLVGKEYADNTQKAQSQRQLTDQSPAKSNMNSFKSIFHRLHRRKQASAPESQTKEMSSIIPRTYDGQEMPTSAAQP